MREHYAEPQQPNQPQEGTNQRASAGSLEVSRQSDDARSSRVNGADLLSQGRGITSAALADEFNTAGAYLPQHRLLTNGRGQTQAMEFGERAADGPAPRLTAQQIHEVQSLLASLGAGALPGDRAAVPPAAASSTAAQALEQLANDPNKTVAQFGDRIRALAASGQTSVTINGEQYRAEVENVGKGTARYVHLFKQTDDGKEQIAFRAIYRPGGAANGSEAGYEQERGRNGAVDFVGTRFASQNRNHALTRFQSREAPPGPDSTAHPPRPQPANPATDHPATDHPAAIDPHPPERQPERQPERNSENLHSGERHQIRVNGAIVDVPDHLDPGKPIHFMTYFNGFRSSYSDEFARAHLSEQMRNAPPNTVLIAARWQDQEHSENPAHKTFDRNGGLKGVLDQVFQQVPELQRHGLNSADTLGIAGFSAGYNPVRQVLSDRSLSSRVTNIVMLDSPSSAVRQFVSDHLREFADGSRRIAMVAGDWRANDYNDFARSLRQQLSRAGYSESAGISFSRTHSRHTDIPGEWFGRAAFGSN